MSQKVCCALNRASYKGAQNSNIQYVLFITGDNSHDYLVKVLSARILHWKVIFFPIILGEVI